MVIHISHIHALKVTRPSGEKEAGQIITFKTRHYGLQWVMYGKLSVMHIPLMCKLGQHAATSCVPTLPN